MKILPVSDVHLDFYRGVETQTIVLDEFPDADVLVVAGDLCEHYLLHWALGYLLARYEHVVYVPGNHEYYGSSLEEMQETRRLLVEASSRLHWLDEGAVEIEGQRFIGCSLWFPDSPEARQRRAFLNDFRHIRGFEKWVWQRFERDRAFLKKEVSPGDVVVTHHMPPPLSIAPQYQGSPLNCYFLGDVSEVVEDGKARLWVHGHTHDAADYVLGETRVFCNPHGYPGERVGYRHQVIEL